MTMFGLAIVLQAAVPATAAVPPRATVQDMFAAADAASAKNDLPAALAGLTALETRLAGGRNARSQAVVRARKGDVLMRMGRGGEAAPLLTAALADLPADDASLADDRFLTRISLARIRLQTLDYPGAVALLQAAQADAKSPVARLNLALLQSQANTFTDPTVALAQIDAAMALARTIPDLDKPTRGILRTQRGRALLNQQDFKAATAELRAAVVDLGGLGMRVDRADVIARSDVGIAAMLAGLPDVAREYLAYTGAGRSEKPFDTASDMGSPPCGTETGLRPDDVAVVEFAIASDGSVQGAVPIYATRPAETAVAFARAVMNWSWTPEAAKKIDPFFRSLIRIQLRCSTAAARPDVQALLAPAVSKWLDDKGVARFDAGGNAARAMPLLRAELARRETEGGVALVPVLLALADNPTSAVADRTGWNRRAATLAVAANAPAEVRAYLATRFVDEGKSKPIQHIPALQAALADPVVAANAHAAGTLRLLIGDWSRIDDPAAAAHYRAVATDTRLDAHDPLHVGALIRLAGVQARAGRIEDARASYRQTGLAAQQCALVDAQPAIKALNMSSDDYPKEAIRWGFGGWAATEFDIDAAGRTVNQRATIAYPPFVFDTAVVKMAKDIRYQQSYRPEGGLGCGGKTIRVSFRMPS